MSRFYCPTTLAVDTQITLPDTVFAHWVKVLRAKQGDTAVLFDGLGGEYTATLLQVDKTAATAMISGFSADNRTPLHRVTLGQVMSKGDRMDYAIQKATELGVSSIQLLVSERCEMRLKYDRDQKKIDHWQNIATAACEQCGMNIVPKILPPIVLHDWLSTTANQDLKLVMALAQQQDPLPSKLPANICLLVGPEGGLSDAEIIAAENSGFLRWQLGSRVLRTETAPVVALAVLNSLNFEE